MKQTYHTGAAMRPARLARVLATVLAALLGAAPHGFAQAQCLPGNENLSVPPSTPAEDFDAAGDGTVLHTPTGLTWQRCVLGQSWTGSGCSGTPEVFTWESALLAAEGHVQDGQSDWRVPDRNELGAIVEDRCFLPALNDQVFADAPGGRSWTSSPAAGQTGQAWTVNFDDGAVAPAPNSQLNPVRLVRKARLAADAPDP